jgi:flagellar motor switch protein FliM
MRFMKIDQIPFTLSVILGKTTLSMKNYLELQVGDILVLDQKVQEKLTVCIGDEERSYATPGLFEKHKAVTLDGSIHP